VSEISVKEAKEITGGLSRTDKMPCHSYNLPASACKTGSILRKVPGSVCSKCYACKGRYLFGNVKKAMAKRLRAIRDPKWSEAMSVLIKKTGDEFFRWHDSGDVQDIPHLMSIFEVALRTPQVQHWLPTKEIEMIVEWQRNTGARKPKNLTIRASLPRLGQIAEARMLGDFRPFWGHKCATTFSGKFNPDERPYEVECPAPNQGGQCLDCRLCWNATACVAYKVH
jgi:hypothetical protein